MRAIKYLLREVFLALGLLTLGLLALPAMVYAVGQVVVGEYEGGLPALYEAIADGLLAGRIFAWLMVLSPYLSIQMIRMWFRLRRPERNVS